jgi:hypothetical protein
MAATIQGNDIVAPGFLSEAGAAAPAGNPQRWQNFAPSISSAPQAAQELPSVVPHSEQNFPFAGAPHFGHAGLPISAGEVIRQS